MIKTSGTDIISPTISSDEPIRLFGKEIDVFSEIF
jgi:hypothetical protein